HARIHACDFCARAAETEQRSRTQVGKGLWTTVDLTGDGSGRAVDDGQGPPSLSKAPPRVIFGRTQLCPPAEPSAHQQRHRVVPSLHSPYDQDQGITITSRVESLAAIRLCTTLPGAGNRSASQESHRRYDRRALDGWRVLDARPPVPRFALQAQPRHRGEVVLTAHFAAAGPRPRRNREDPTRACRAGRCRAVGGAQPADATE